jgi:Integrase core domain
VLFDRVCVENGVRHLLTAPYSPTTTGKVERFHKAMRAEWVRPNDRRFPTIVEPQTSLDAWWGVQHGASASVLGGLPPIERFRIAERSLTIADVANVSGASGSAGGIVDDHSPGRGGTLGGSTRSDPLAGFHYPAGPTFAGEHVEVVVIWRVGGDLAPRRVGGQSRAAVDPLSSSFASASRMAVAKSRTIAQRLAEIQDAWAEMLGCVLQSSGIANPHGVEGSEIDSARARGGPPQIRVR